MRVVIFVNGNVQDYDLLERFLQPDDYLIAADGGANHCLALNRIPHALIGDLDSVDPATVDKLAARQIYIERHPPAKSETDLELALVYALRVVDEHARQHAKDRRISELVLVGAMGGRLDQTLGNVLLLAQREWPIPLLLVEGNTVAHVVFPSQPIALRAGVGDTVSALPLSDVVTGITYTGMRFPLHDHTLTLGSTRGISNVVVEAPATVRITSGKLLMVETLGDPDAP